MQPNRVLLADDHKLMRAGIRSLVKELQNVEVVGEATTGQEAVDLVAKLRPDIVLMDIMMPEMNGLEAIVAKFPKVRVIILSMNANEDHVLQALRSGASGYLLKNIGPDELESAIRAVSNGDKHITASVAKHVIAGLVDDVKATSLERLTPRQRQVLQFVAEGKSSKEIAKRLKLSVKTIEAHRSELMKNLDIHDVAGLVRYAIRVDLINADD